LLDADADRADLELRLIKLTPKDRVRVHPFAGNGSSWRNADIRQIARVGYGGNNRRRTGLIAAIAHGVVSVFEGQADAFRC
jgi:hypothetical protein